MWTCPKCKIEVESGFELCWACGTSRDGEETPGFDPEAEGIMGADEYAAETEAKRREKLVTLATFWNAPEAHILRSRLEAEGVTAIVTDELSGAWGLANNLGTVKVEVPEVQLPKARDVLDSLGTEPEVGIIAKAVKEGIQTKASPPAEASTDVGSGTPRPLPVKLIMGLPCVLVWPVLLILLVLLIICINWLV